MSFVHLAKSRLPSPMKDGIELGVRVLGSATADLRPPPDFFVVGTKRGGTTSLWEALLSHPQIMPMVPAAKNLKSPQYLFAEYHRGVRWYLGHFPTRWARDRHTAKHGRAIAGEASPGYLWDPRVPRRAARLAPQAKIVMLLRDPTRRALSHWQERTKQGTERLSFEAALAAEEGRLCGELERMAEEPLYYSRAHDWYSYRSRGIYVDQVARWQAWYPPGQVLICRSEDFYAEGEAVLQQIIGFLGIDDAPIQLIRRNTSLDQQLRLDGGTERTLRTFFAPYNQQVGDLLGRDFGWRS